MRWLAETLAGRAHCGVSWIVLALVAQALWGVADVTDKLLRQRYLENSLALAIGLGLFALPTSLVIAAFRGYGFDGWPTVALLVSGVIGPPAFALYFRAISLDEASRVVPLFNLTPVWTALLATVFLAEVLPWPSWIAFGLILAGGTLISLHGSRGLRLSPALLFMAGCTAALATGYVLQRAVFLGTEIDGWDVAKWSTLGYTLGALLLLAIPGAGGRALRAIGELEPTGWGLLVGNQFGLTSVARVLMVFALAAGPAALVSVMSAFQGAFVLLYAVLFARFWPELLDEDVKGSTLVIKLGALGLMGAGMIILGLTSAGAEA